MSERSQSEDAGLRRLRLPTKLCFAVIVLVSSLIAAPSLRSQPHRSSGKSVEHSNLSYLPEDLRQRLVELDSAKQLGDPKEIAASSRRLIGLALRNVGRITLAQGDASSAVELYKRARDFEDSAGAQVDLANAFVRGRRLDEALSVVTDVLVADSQNASAWYMQGKIWILKSKYEEAAKSFSRAVELQSDPAAWYLMGAAFLQLKQGEQAKDAFAHLNQIPLNAGARKSVGDAYALAGYDDGAAPRVRSAGARAPRPSSIEVLISNAAGFDSKFERPRLSSGRNSTLLKAKTELRNILAGALNDLGTAEARQEQYELALAHFHEAANWDAELPGLTRNIGIAAGRAMNYAECIRALRPVLTKDPKDNVARALLGTALFSTEAYAEAVQVFAPLGNSVLQIQELAYSWASSLVHTNKFAEAADLLSKLEQQQVSTQTLMLIIPLWSQMGNYEHTVELCHRALQLDPKQLRAHYLAGLALLRLNRSEEASRELQSELELDAHNVDAQYHLGFSLLQLSQNQRAVELWKQVLLSRPDHPEANYELGKELLIEGKAQEAVSYLEASVRLKPQFEPAHYQLQSAYRAVGRKEDAAREADVYRALKEKSRNITLPPPHAANSTHAPTK